MDQPVTRRDFLRVAGLGATLTALAACAPESTLESAAPSATAGSPLVLDREGLLLHTLRRASFGPTADGLAEARQLGLEGWLEQQLEPAGLDLSDLQSRLAEFQTLEMSPTELTELNDNALVVRELVAATITRQVFSPAQLYEVMVDFWTNHFSIYAFSQPELYLKGQDDREVIRAHALGSFPDLLRASAHSPAMLVYLDNAQSSQPEPNENYARELLELHTLGVDGGYSYNDIQAVARAFTGWSVERLRRRGNQPGGFVYRSEWHDTEAKTVLDQSLPGGQADGDRVLEILAAHPSTARHIAEKLTRRFVSDDPPNSLVESVAGSYAANNGDIPSMLRTIFHSDEFAAASGLKLKRPLDFVVSTLRVTGADGQLDRPLRGFLQLLGQMPFGWPAPDGYPDDAAAWTSTNQSLYRWNLALTLASGRIPGVSLQLPTGNGADIPKQVDALSAQLLAEPLASDARQLLIDFAQSLGAGQLPRQLEISNLLAGLVLCSPQFQLR